MAMTLASAGSIWICWLSAGETQVARSILKPRVPASYALMHHYVGYELVAVEP